MTGGIELSFKDKGLTVILLTIIPQLCEASIVAILSRNLFQMPWTLCFANGFCLGAVSPAVLVPSLLKLQNEGFGEEKGIPLTMIAASSFDDIIAITVFGVFTTLAFEPYGGTILFYSVHELVLRNIFEILTGLIFGLLLGSLMYFIRDFRQTIKFTVMLILAISTPILSYVTDFPEGKYVAIITYGYTCNCIWKQKPQKQLEKFWIICAPLLFGTVGASLNLHKLDFDILGKAVLLVICGLSVRWIGSFLATSVECKYTLKEKIFISFGWIPKATVQAAISGQVLVMAEKLNVYQEFGNNFVTVAVVAILISAPSGAILINVLGPKCLDRK